MFNLICPFHLQCSLPESNVSGDQPPLSLGSTDEGSWIQVDENEAQPTRWVPDHAATNCAKCDTQFWIANRKHHCRYSLLYWILLSFNQYRPLGFSHLMIEKRGIFWYVPPKGYSF